MTASDLLKTTDKLTCDELRWVASWRSALSSMPGGDESDGVKARAILAALDAHEADVEEGWRIVW